MILVTGASGYIGKNFIKKFQNKYKIRTFSLQKEALENLNLSNIDTVIHCAALVHQKKIYPQEEYNRINLLYPIQLAKKAKASGVKQFIFISTIAVYGEETELLTENTKCNPITPYGKSKLEAEKQLLELSDDNFIVSIVRPPMVYGKNAPGNIGSLINLVKKIPLLPFANITNKRSFVYIENLIFLINRIIEKKVTGIFLASDNTAISTTYLIKHISKALNRSIYLIQVPFFATLLKIVKPSLYKRLYENLKVDNDITKKTLDFKNPYSTEEGIKYMIHGEKK